MVAPVKAIPVGAVVVTVPPQAVAVPLVTVNPVGNVSVTATPVSAAVFAAGLVMVKVSAEVALKAIDAGLNAAAIDGGPSTLVLAEAVPPGPPSVEVTAPVVLFFVPTVVPVTLTANVQELLAATVPPERLTAPEPAVAVMVPLPQDPVKPLGVETTIPAGSVSVNATPEADVVLLFWSVKLRLVEPFSGIVAAPNALPIDGGPMTVREALEVLLVPASKEVRVTELFFTPAKNAPTFTDTVQDALLARVPPEKLTTSAPAMATGTPPHVLLKAGVDATIMPAGRLSVNSRPVSEVPLMGLLMWNVNEVVPLNGMVAAPKDFVMVGGTATLRFAEAVLPVPPFVEVTAPVVLV